MNTQTDILAHLAFSPKQLEQGCQEQWIYLCFPAENLAHDCQSQSDDFCFDVVKI